MDSRQFINTVCLYTDPATDDANFNQAFKAFASETEDNLAALVRVHYTHLEDAFPGDNKVGLSVGPRRVPLSSVSHALESMPVPKDITEYIADGLSQDEWEAAMRVITVILSALEHKSGS